MRLDPSLCAFLESGAALIVGSVGADGDPFASRGWGLRVTDPVAGRFRLLVPARDTAHLQGPVAVTGADVATLRSVQVKGTILAVEPAVPGDGAVLAGYCDGFFGAVEATDGTPRSLLERLVPDVFAVAIVEADELFDQTPGPGAGARLEPSDG